jgi:AcrR family transcriptional regulator
LLLRRRAGRRDGRASGKAVKNRPQLLSGEDLPQRPRQKRSLDRRDQLKAAGLALFGEKGWEQTSIDEIARRANLPVGSFYQHFRSKRQLLLALMDELLENLARLDLRPGNVKDVQYSLRVLLASAFSADLRYLGAYRAWREAALADPDVARKERRIRAWTNGRVLSLFQALQNVPGARPNVDVAALARLMDTFFWTLLGEAYGARRRDLHRWVESAADLIYHALFADPL